MITVNDISVSPDNSVLAFVEGSFCVEFESCSINASNLEFAMLQFCCILNLVSDDNDFCVSIEHHMAINGFDGVANVYVQSFCDC